jgi:hypothetical protein
MPATHWLAWAALAAAALATSLWYYHRRETPGYGRTLLALLRAAAVALLLLVLFSPELPGRAGVAGRGTQVLLDASLSMTVPAGTDTAVTRWQQAVSLARSRAGGRPVLLFGDQARPLAAGSLPERAPGDLRSLLLPALQAAAEAGVRRVLVITDGGIEDLDAVMRWAPRLGVEIQTEVVGDDIVIRAIVEASAPSWAEAGQPVLVEFGVLAPPDDSVRVTVRRGAGVVGHATVASPAPGRLAGGAIELRLEPPPGGGWVRLELELEGDEAVADGDRRTVYVHVSDEPSGVGLVSLRPDWEPRFLGPVLEQALGVPLRAYLRGAGDRYVRLGAGLQAGAAATEADVQRALRRAELLVVHGVDADVPAWLAAAMAGARGLLVFPATDAAGTAVPGLPLAVGAEAAGGYYPVAAVPPSPVAALLADLELAAAAPLTGLRSAEPPPGAWAPLLVARGRQGVPQPLALAGQSGGRRWAVALASGYWQWAFRGDDDGQLYARLWGALAGWLVRERGTAAFEPVRPARMAAPRGAPLDWVAPGLDADSLALRLTRDDGTLVLDTVVAMAPADTARTAAPPPGHYAYQARAFAAGTVTEAAGQLTVERYSPELTRPRADLAALHALPAPVRTAAAAEARTAATPLHASPLPYVVLVLILAAEWILRRRWGLR